MMPSAMPARTARGLRRGELVVELPLQPAVEVDCVGVLGGEVGDRRAGRVPQLVGPLVPVGAVLLGQRAPGRRSRRGCRPRGPGRRA